MIESFYSKNKEIVDKILFIAVFTVFIYVFVKYLFYYVAPFVFGYLISLIIQPFVSLLYNKFKIHRGISTFILIIILILLITVLGTSIITRVIDELKSFALLMPTYIDQSADVIDDITAKYKDFLAFIPDELEVVSQSAMNSLASSLTGSVSGIVRQGSVNIVGFIPNFIMSFMLCIISAFFFTKDKLLIARVLKSVLPLWISGKVHSIRDGLFKAVGGYLKAQLILMCITATICVTGLSIIKFPYALMIGMIASFIDALPVFGVGFVLWPLAGITAILGDYLTAVKIMIIYGVVFVTRQVNEPKILGDQIGLHPLLTLMAIYIGMRVFGVLGFLIGPMILVVSNVILTTEIAPETSDMQNS